MTAPLPPETFLDTHVAVERRYQRSIRLDADLGVFGALQGYVLHESARAALATMARLIDAGQGAFTWTGPYGGGKSSLALALASFVAPHPEAQTEAEALLGDVADLGRAFAGCAEGWLPVLLTGRRADPVADLRAALAQAIADAPGRARTRRPKAVDPAGRDVIERLTREAEARPGAGVLVVIDELGKYLEAVAEGTGDLHVFQDLAEAANRSDGRLIVVGILHQAFERYAERLGARVQDEWAKIQGRYVDVPIVTAADEVIDLVGRAVHAVAPHPGSRAVAERVAAAIAARRPGTSADLAARLDACWPLHPVTAALLGPVSRRRFGQNERSVFGFLASAEPGGFAEFLAATPTHSGRTFEPADLWDYLRLNLEPAILASPDGHRWAQAAEAVERAGRGRSVLHERLAKTAAIVDLFADGSGLAADDAALAVSVGAAEAEASAALADLVGGSVLVFRRHLGAYAVYAGSDFDIESEVAARLEAHEGLDLRALNRLADLRPVLAKAHHHRTGTPRWFEASLAELSPDGLSTADLRIAAGAAGAFRLALPSAEFSEEEAQAAAREASAAAGELPVAVGVPRGHEAIRALGRELVALREVREASPELEGDAVARREVEARLELLAARFEEALRAALDKAMWFCRGKALEEDGGRRSLSRFASALADQTFPNAPIIHSELINRQRPSANTNAALRPLLHAMVRHEGEEAFGIEGYPPERGLVAAVLEGPRLYAPAAEGWGFVDPTEDEGAARAFAPLWREADALLESGEPVPLADLFDAWEKPPYGLRRGAMPILAVAYLATRRDRTALYVDGMFQPALVDLLLDRLLQDAGAVAVCRVAATAEHQSAVAHYAAKLEELTGQQPAAELLPVAQGLVEFAFTLPSWSRHARGALSERAVRVRHALLHAHDPHRLLGEDLPRAVDATTADAPRRVCEALEELHGAYPGMLAGLRDQLLAGLKHRGASLEPLRRRAQAIRGGGGDDLKLQGFIARLAAFDGSLEQTAGLCGLVTGQPVAAWRDLEPGRAGVHLADYAYRFRRVELFGDAKDPTQTAVMMMAGVGAAERSVVRRAQVSLEDRRRVEPVVEGVTRLIDEAGLEQDLLLAVLAEVAHRRLEDDGEADISAPIAADRSAL